MYNASTHAGISCPFPETSSSWQLDNITRATTAKRTKFFILYFFSKDSFQYQLGWGIVHYFYQKEPMQEILRPTVLLDWGIAERNLQRMLDKAKQHGLQLRPHLKTAQSIDVARKFREMGIEAITVSSLSMASYFAADGWRNITIAFPVNTRENGIIQQLSRKVKLNLLVVNQESIELLSETFPAEVGIFIKIDVGTHRTGIDPSDHKTIQNCIDKIGKSPSLKFRGFLAHAGHSYSARSKDEILKVHRQSTAILKELKSKYPEALISTGDTPTCSVAENWEGIDEVRPGNFIFYDLMQTQIGSCKMEDIAVTLACPIVAKHADRQEVIVYGGGIHLSKDRMEWEGKTIFGRPVLLNEKTWEMPEEDCYVKSISQEHGVIKCSSSFYEKLNIGGLVGILPVHSCMMVDLMDGLLTTDGEYLNVM